jgi:UDPglucose 6-dehydrogenase
MLIGIAGFGFVGDALHHGISHFRSNEKFNELISGIQVYDPHKLPDSKIESLKNCDITFICVPTPMGKNGDLDDSIIDDVLSELNSIGHKGVVCIKSTVLPTSISKFKDTYRDLRITTNPEFLTERSARIDFINSEWVLLGGDDVDLEPLVKFYRLMFNIEETPFQKFKEIDIIKVSAEEAVMAKYMTNTWFAVKVSLMNEFYSLWNSLNPNRSSWDDVVKAFSADPRVGPTHLDVPGPDGDFGWGGRCFPKDLNALIGLSNKHFCLHNVMKAAWQTNLVFRSNRDWLKIPGATNEEYDNPN